MRHGPLCEYIATSRRQLTPQVIPIPGSSNPERARQNVEAANIKLDESDKKTINDVLAMFTFKGGRYPDSHSAALMV